MANLIYNKSPFPDLAAAVEAVHHRHLAQGEQIQVRYFDEHKEVHSFVVVGEECGHPSFLGHPFEHHIHNCVINYEIDGGVINLKDDKDEYPVEIPHHVHCHDVYHCEHHHHHCEPHPIEPHHHHHCEPHHHHHCEPHPIEPHHHHHCEPYHHFVKDDYDQFSYTERDGMNESPIEFDNDEFDNVRITDY